MKVGKNNMGQHAEVKIYEFMTKSQHCCQLLQKTNLVDRELSEQLQIRHRWLSFTRLQPSTANGTKPTTTTYAGPSGSNPVRNLKLASLPNSFNMASIDYWALFVT